MWDVDGDGNCLFSSLQLLLKNVDGSEGRFDDCRAFVCDYMLTNPLHDELVSSEVMAAMLSREEYSVGTGIPLDRVRDPFVATWSEYVAYSATPGVYAADFLQGCTELCFQVNGYTLRLWESCAEGDFRLFEDDDKRWLNDPDTLSRYSLLRQINERRAAGTCGYLDLLYHGKNHYRALKIPSSAEFLSRSSIVDSHSPPTSVAQQGAYLPSRSISHATVDTNHRRVVVRVAW